MVPCINTNVQVMFFDTDCGGVVSNIAYLRFIEIARTRLAEKLGLALARDGAKSKRIPSWCAPRSIIAVRQTRRPAGD